MVNVYRRIKAVYRDMWPSGGDCIRKWVHMFTDDVQPSASYQLYLSVLRERNAQLAMRAVAL